MTFDTVVAGGLVITASGQRRCDVGVNAGVIAALDADLRGVRTIDATGLYVLPGGVDPHVHLTPMADLPSGASVRPDDFWSGSCAALAGGITTIGNMTHQAVGERLGEGLDRDLTNAAELAACDFFLHPVLNDPTVAVIDELASLPDRGVMSVKVFMSFPGFEEHSDRFRAATERARAAGLVTLVHAEDGAAIRHQVAESVRAGRTGIVDYVDAHPVDTEVAAVEAALAGARAGDGGVYIVHLSSADALAAVVRARARGIPALAETRPLYLHFTRAVFERPDGPAFLGNPPMRSEHDRQALWDGIATGTIDTVASDHAPWTIDQKLDPNRDITSFLPGVADLETLRPLLWSEGVATGRITPEAFVAVTATNAARIFGLYPRKGTIEVGSDADLVLWDPAVTRRVDGSQLISRAGYSVYDGMDVTGWPVMTMSRGDVVFDGSRTTAESGRGMFVAARRET